MSMNDDGAAVYYSCSSCRRRHRDDELKHLPILDLRICPTCSGDFQGLEFCTLETHDLLRVAEGLRNLPDTAGQIRMV